MQMIYASEIVNMFYESVSRFLSSENELLCFGIVFRKLTRWSEDPLPISGVTLIIPVGILTYF